MVVVTYIRLLFQCIYHLSPTNRGLDHLDHNGKTDIMNIKYKNTKYIKKLTPKKGCQTPSGGKGIPAFMGSHLHQPAGQWGEIPPQFTFSGILLVSGRLPPMSCFRPISCWDDTVFWAKFYNLKLNLPEFCLKTRARPQQEAGTVK